MALLSAAVGGAWWLSAQVNTMLSNDKILIDKVEDLLVGQQELLATMSCLPRAFSSVSAGLREAAAGGPLRALVAASPDECAAWLAAAGFAQYALALAPLGGATLLLQTPASLKLAGVAPQHVAPLLEKIIAAAAAPPETDDDTR